MRSKEDKDLISYDDVRYSESDKDVAEVKTCRILRPLGFKVLLSKLNSEIDELKALEMIRAYLESEKGATTDNAIVNLLADGKYPKKRFVNITDEGQLWPFLLNECKREVEQRKQHKDRALYYLSTFEARWQRGKASTGSQEGAKRGRSNMPFESVLIGDEAKKKQTLERLHKLIDGRKGVSVALAIRKAVEGGLITKPTFRQVKAEFGDIGAESGYNKAYRNNAFASEEGNGVQKILNEDGAPKQ